MATISSVIRSLLSLTAILVVSLGLAACGGDQPVRTMEDILSEVEGTRLSAAETASLVETADLLCAMDTKVLAKALPAVDSERLNYLDWVFSERCPTRNKLYQEVLMESFPEHVQKSDG